MAVSGLYNAVGDEYLNDLVLRWVLGIVGAVIGWLLMA